MRDILLNGAWKYRIGYGEFEEIDVPFSRLPVGRSECVRHFDVTEEFERAFVRFDGITYHATVFLNEVRLGEMLPYCEYEFEVTDILREGGNLLSVELEDIQCDFGPSEGWENFGGIIRDVHLIFRDKAFIKGVFFRAELGASFEEATVEVDVFSDGADGQECYEIKISGGDRLISKYKQGKGTVSAKIDGICPWSPDNPKLYTLSVDMLCDGRVIDTYTETVGFKSLTCERHRFLLNGKPLFLRGVCKHEMIGESGHCPSEADMERDMRIIKDMGCNFVRLVHYPHNKKILEIADRIGLLVSEEPGLWWSDTANEKIASGSLEVLKRTVLRDRNHPSVAFWLCFNECKFTEDFLVKSAAVCRKYDPTRPVSGANCMTNEETLLYYNKCGFDFYTMHPYSDTFERARESAKLLSDKPLVFTEWGGYFVYDNPHLLLDFIKEMRELYIANSDEGALAGAFFWFFAELNDFSRGAPACIDGVLREGLVTSDRMPTLIYNAFVQGMKSFDEEVDGESRFWAEVCEGFSDIKGFKPMRVRARSGYARALALARSHAEAVGCMRKRQIKVGATLSALSPLSDVPCALANGECAVFECGEAVKKIRLVGLTTLVSGYPLGGKYGEEAATLTLVFEDGERQNISLQNGVHITTAFGINASSRIEPFAAKASRLLKFGYDKNFEIYVINSLDVEVKEKKQLRRVELCGACDEYMPMLYDVLYM